MMIEEGVETLGSHARQAAGSLYTEPMGGGGWIKKQRRKNGRVDFVIFCTSNCTSRKGKWTGQALWMLEIQIECLPSKCATIGKEAEVYLLTADEMKRRVFRDSS
jgi:hypothetical protein